MQKYNRRKKNNPKLIKKEIINKKGEKQVVYINPNKTITEIRKELKEKNKLFANPVTRKLIKEKVSVSNKGKVYLNLDTYEGLQEKYKARPITWKIMTNMTWENLKKGKKGKLTNKEWKVLLKETDKLIHFVAKKYSFGEVYTDRFKELKLVGQSALVEAVNNYHKVFNKKKPFDFQKFAHVYILGRIKETVANRLDAGLRVPKFLQKPYQEYIDVKNKLQIKLGTKPSREVIAKELQKIWTKQTFYSQYRTTEGKTFGDIYEVKDKKGNVLYKGDNLKLAKKKYVKGKTVLTKRKKGFTELTDVEKKKVSKQDQLPLEGWITVNKEGVLQDKEDKHEQNLSKIENDFQQRKENLEAVYYSTNSMSNTDRKNAKTIMDELQRRLDDTQKKIKDVKQEKLDKIIVLEAEIKSAKDKFDELDKTIKDKKRSKQYNEAKKNLAILNSDKYRDESVRDINLKLKNLREVEQSNLNDIRLSKQLFEPMTDKVFNERLNDLERLKQQELDNERKRHNKDTSSTYIPGVIERVKEFEQIEAIKEQPLNLYVNDDEGDSRSNLEVTYTPDELSQEERVTLLEQHEIAKQVLKDHLGLLVPVYKDIMSLRMGLHEKSKPTVDNLWGELATAKEIVSYLEKKHKNILSNEDKFLNLVNNKLKSEADKFLMIKSVPFIGERYFYNPELIKKDFDVWQKSKPVSGKSKKVKLNPKTYNKLQKTYRANIKKAKDQWTKWRKKNKGYSQKTSTKVYEALKKKYKAAPNYKPKRFINVIEKKIDPKRLNAWQQKKPKIFTQSYSTREKFVLNAIQDSTEILRRTVPLKAVKDLLSAHRRLVEAGVTAEKSVNEEFSKLQNLIIKSLDGMKL